MKLLKCSLAMLALSSSVALAEDCAAPQAPAMPDGASSTMEEMVSGQQALKAYQVANNEYRACLDTVMAEAQMEAKEGDEEAVEEFNEAQTNYNASVTAEEELAGQFNTEVREYKAAHPE